MKSLSPREEAEQFERDYLYEHVACDGYTEIAGHQGV